MNFNIFKFLRLKEGDYITVHKTRMRVCKKYKWDEVWICREEFYDNKTVPTYCYSILEYLFGIEIV